MKKKVTEFWVWRFGADVRIYRLAAESESQAQELVEKYPYQSHQVIYQSHQVISSANRLEEESGITFKVVKVPESVEEIFDRIFSKQRKGKGKRK